MASACVFRPAGPAPEATGEVEAAELEYQRAVQASDHPRQRELLAPDYTLTTPFGDTLDRDAIFTDPCYFELVVKHENLRVLVIPGNRAAVVQFEAIAFRPGLVERHLRVVRLWERRDGKWLARLTQQTSMKGTPPNDDRRTTADSRTGTDRRRECGWS